MQHDLKSQMYSEARERFCSVTGADRAYVLGAYLLISKLVNCVRHIIYKHNPKNYRVYDVTLTSALRYLVKEHVVLVGRTVCRILDRY